ncbi:MAG: phosphoserine phosphatase SerB, partial [Candidatus Latescibacterota bacterium]
MNDKTHVIVTVSGHDSPGITAAFAQVIAGYDAEIIDIDQATVHNILALSFLLDLGGASQNRDAVLKDLLFEANRLGMSLDFQLLSKDELPDKSRRNLFVLTVFGGTRPLAEITSILGDEGVNIDEIAAVGDESTRCVELTVDVPDTDTLTRLKERMLIRSHELDLDFAIQKADAFRKSKRMVVFDMDRTLVTTEIIDELAVAAKCHKEVARLTELTMKGDLDFEKSLRQRVALLRGLTVEQLETIRDGLELSEGVPELTATLKRQGFKIGLISGGFDFFARALEQRLGLDFAFANSLEIVGGKLTGRITGKIIDAAAKAAIVKTMGGELGIPADQTVA